MGISTLGHSFSGSINMYSGCFVVDAVGRIWSLVILEYRRAIRTTQKGRTWLVSQARKERQTRLKLPLISFIFQNIDTQPLYSFTQRTCIALPRFWSVTALYPLTVARLVFKSKYIADDVAVAEPVPAVQ